MRAPMGTSSTASRSPAVVNRAIEVPGFIRWAAAAFVDVVLFVAFAAAAIFAALSARGVRVAVQPIVDDLAADVVTGVATFFVPTFVALFLLQTITVLVLGATVGQRLMGLRVLRVHNGAKPGIVRILVRAFGSALGVIALGIGPFWALWLDSKRRGLGDILARTVVAKPPAPTGDGA